MSTKTETLDLTLVFHDETEKAIIVSEDGDDTKTIALPKSRVEFEFIRPARGMKRVEVQIPDWLAEKEGLV